MVGAIKDRYLAIRVPGKDWFSSIEEAQEFLLKRKEEDDDPELWIIARPMLELKISTKVDWAGPELTWPEEFTWTGEPPSVPDYAGIFGGIHHMPNPGDAGKYPGAQDATAAQAVAKRRQELGELTAGRPAYVYSRIWSDRDDKLLMDMVTGGYSNIAICQFFRVPMGEINVRVCLLQGKEL